MDARLIDRLESSVEHTASLLFAAAVAYAVYRLAGVPDPQLLAFALAALATAYLLSMRTLASVSGQNNDFRVSIFDAREIEAQGPDELLLTAEDRLHGASELLLTEADRLDASELLLTDRLDTLSVAPAPLVLDDVLGGAPVQDARTRLRGGRQRARGRRARSASQDAGRTLFVQGVQRFHPFAHVSRASYTSFWSY